ALQVRRSASEADVERVTVDHQRGLAEAELRELGLQRLGLGTLAHVEVVEDDQLAALCLGRQRHLQAERPNLLVEARGEDAGPRAVRLAAADENRGAAIAVTGRAATLLAAELLAGAGNVRALTSRTRRGATVDELPGYHAVKDVGARLDAEHVIVELNVAASLGVEGLNLDLHRLAFLALVGLGLVALGFGVLSFSRFGLGL